MFFNRILEQKLENFAKIKKQHKEVVLEKALSYYLQSHLKEEDIYGVLGEHSATWKKPIHTNSNNPISLSIFHKCCLVPFFGEISRELSKNVYIDCDFTNPQTIYNALTKHIDKNYEKTHFHTMFYPTLLMEIKERDKIMQSTPKNY